MCDLQQGDRAIVTDVWPTSDWVRKGPSLIGREIVCGSISPASCVREPGWLEGTFNFPTDDSNWHMHVCVGFKLEPVQPAVDEEYDQYDQEE